MSTMTWMKRLAAGAALATGPALFALGSAADSWAEAGSLSGGPNLTQPAHHDAFPGQLNQPQPGSREHHRHQWNRAG